ncbi:MAG: helix-turn-helix domain-containing protein, partial [Lachnospiraceae bacterium]|nr:helix-turn-helix domain-containing protein [Lachnospiraceae bacterium]
MVTVIFDMVSDTVYNPVQFPADVFRLPNDIVPVSSDFDPPVSEAQGMFYYYLNKIQYISETRTDETVLAMNACILQFFVLISEKGRQNSKSVYHLPQKKALESGSRVTEAFQLSGYHTMSSFISAFKKFVNMTPSEYRKRISDT